MFILYSLRTRARNWCMHWAYASGTDACTEHAHQELMLTWANESGTGACTEHTHQEQMRAQSTAPSKYAEHTHQELMRAQSTAPSKYAEHTHQERMRTLCIRVRNWCVPWANGLGAKILELGFSWFFHHKAFLGRCMTLGLKYKLVTLINSCGELGII